MDHSRPDQNAEKGTPPDLRRLATVLAAGFFSTTLAQPEVIELPLQGLLKEVLHLSVTQMSLFFSIGALAWYCKPFVGIIADSYPLLGTHRLGYIVLGAVIAAACWLAAGVAPLRYTFLLGIVLMINAGLVIASTAVGGLLVEVSRRYDASAQLFQCDLLSQELVYWWADRWAAFWQPLHLASPQRFVPWLRFLSFQLQ